jgi:ATP-binding cassette subfamily B protein
MALFTIRGMATYGQSVMLMRIANRIIAINRKLLFDRLLNQNLSYFATRHSSEFLMGTSNNASRQRSANLTP